MEVKDKFASFFENRRLHLTAGLPMQRDSEYYDSLDQLKIRHYIWVLMSNRIRVRVIMVENVLK